MQRKEKFISLGVFAALILAGFWWLSADKAPDNDRAAVLSHYADIAHAVFSDSAAKAEALREAVEDLAEDPGSESLEKARQAWREARVPYMQSEVFRFGHPSVDQWETQVNAWPLDEGLIDYVSGDYVHEGGNIAANANIIANTSLELQGQTLVTDEINAGLLARLNEYGGSEANVATGYHAIEFLLWGQDLNGHGPGAGERPATDFSARADQCSNGPAPAQDARPCARRLQYLRVATDKLVADLRFMAGQWASGVTDNYRETLLTLPAEEALRRVFLGVGSLALGELAGERMKVALIANSPEDEHDCFSDNTHWSHFYNVQGIANVYHGHYSPLAGDVLDGPGIKYLLQQQAPQTAQAVTASLQQASQALRKMVERAEAGMHFDQMVAPGNSTGSGLIREAIDALVQLAADIETAAAELGLDKARPDDAGHAF